MAAAGAGTWTKAGGVGGASGGRAGLDADKMRRIARLAKLARLMDTAIRIPGTGIRFGADSVLGLLPVVGDASGAVIGLVIVNEARRLGLPPEKLARMVANIATDAVVGSVPLVGDLFDVYFKSHRRNAQIIFEHFDVSADEVMKAAR